MKLLIVDSTVIKNVCKGIPSIDDLRPDCIVAVTDEGYISYRETDVPSFKISQIKISEILFQCRENSYPFQLFVLFPELQIVNYYMTSKARLVIYALLTSTSGGLFSVKDLSDRLAIPWQDANIIVNYLMSIGYVVKYYASKKITPMGIQKMKEELRKFETECECEDATDACQHPHPIVQ